MNRTFLIIAGLVVLTISPVWAQENSYDHLGKTCEQILAMKVEDWSELYVQKKQGGEVGYDQAYIIYAECRKKKNDAAMSRLPAAAAQRLRRYRKLCGGFHEDSLYVQQAYAGGGTAYTHGAARGQVEDEALVAALLRVYQKPVPGRQADDSAAKLARIRRRITALNPATPRNRKKLAEFSMGEQGRTSYAEWKQRFNALATMLPSERPDARSILLKFIDNYSKILT